MLHGQVNYGVASSFLRELPEELMHWITPRLAMRGEGFAAFTASPTAAAPAMKSAPWRVGQRVFHQKFGEGTVLDLKGGGDGQVQVNFKHAGTKWLALEYAKLTAA
jgi:DNA helicase-2/ATP-dependent DNA helicase PcrA